MVCVIIGRERVRVRALEWNKENDVLRSGQMSGIAWSNRRAVFRSFPLKNVQFILYVVIFISFQFWASSSCNMKTANVICRHLMNFRIWNFWWGILDYVMCATLACQQRQVCISIYIQPTAHCPLPTHVCAMYVIRLKHSQPPYFMMCPTKGLRQAYVFVMYMLVDTAFVIIYCYFSHFSLSCLCFYVHRTAR